MAASTKMGFIASDFSAVTTHYKLIGASASGDSGRAPSVMLALLTDTGSVYLWRTKRSLHDWHVNP
jgi:hypothetical protein